MISLMIYTKYSKNSFLHNLFQKIKLEEILPNTFYKASIIIIPNKKGLKKGKPTFVMNIETDIFNKMLANKCSPYIERIIHDSQVEFDQSYFNI